LFKTKIILLIAALVLIGVAPFALVRFFDFDKLLHKAEQIVEQKTGSPFKVGSMSLGFRGGLSLELRDIRFDGRKGAEDPLIIAEKIHVRLKFLPLLKKQIRVTEVVLDRPRVSFVRDARGQWNLPQLPDGPAGEGAAYLIAQLSVRGGEISWIDVMRPEFAGSIRYLDAELKGISPTAPALLRFKAAMPDSAQQNFLWEGTVGPFSGISEPKVDGTFKLGLNGFDVAAIKRRLGAQEFPISDAPLSGFVEGTLKGPADFARVQAEGRLQVSGVESRMFRAPLEDLKASWHWTGEAAGFKDVSAKLGVGTLTGDAEITSPLHRPVARVRLAVRNVEAHDVTPNHAGRWEIYGKVSADGEFGFDPSSRAAVLATLSGAGQFELSAGILTNINVLSLVTEKVSKFVQFDIRPSIHPNFQPLLQSRDMTLNLAQSRFSIENGNVKVNEVTLISNEFEVRGSGNVSMKGRVHLGCVLIISQALTAEIVRSVPDFEAIVDQGRLVFPFSVMGLAKKPAFVIDKEYLTARVVAVKGRQLIQNVLQKGTNTANQAGATAGDLLKNVF